MDKFTHSNKTYNESFANSYDIITGHKEYVEEVKQLDQILNAFNITKDAKLLDVGCGTGNHSVLLADYGYDITAVDLSLDMIAVAQSKNSKVNFQSGDITELDLGLFKGAYSLFNVVNCIPSSKILKAFFLAIYNQLEEGALYVFESWNPIAVLQAHPEKVSRKYEFNGFEIDRSVTPTWDFMDQHLRLVYDVSVNNADGSLYDDFKVDMDLKLYTPLELTHLLEEVGFKNIQYKTALPDYEVAEESSRMLLFTCQQ